jgi:hydroxymethylglutaryl-CoA lyase
MLDPLGIETGIDVKKVCEAVSFIAPHVSRPIETGMYRLFRNGQL